MTSSRSMDLIEQTIAPNHAVFKWKGQNGFKDSIDLSNGIRLNVLHHRDRDDANKGRVLLTLKADPLKILSVRVRVSYCYEAEEFEHLLDERSFICVTKRPSHGYNKTWKLFFNLQNDEWPSWVRLHFDQYVFYEELRLDAEAASEYVKEQYEIQYPHGPQAPSFMEVLIAMKQYPKSLIMKGLNQTTRVVYSAYSHEQWWCEEVYYSMKQDRIKELKQDLGEQYRYEQVSQLVSSKFSDHADNNMSSKRRKRTLLPEDPDQKPSEPPSKKRKIGKDEHQAITTTNNRK